VKRREEHTLALEMSHNLKTRTLKVRNSIPFTKGHDRKRNGIGTNLCTRKRHRAGIDPTRLIRAKLDAVRTDFRTEDIGGARRRQRERTWEKT